MTELFSSWSLNPAFAEVSRDKLMGMAIKAAADERERQERLQLDREKWEYERARKEAADRRESQARRE